MKILELDRRDRETPVRLRVERVDRQPAEPLLANGAPVPFREGCQLRKPIENVDLIVGQFRSGARRASLSAVDSSASSDSSRKPRACGLSPFVVREEREHVSATRGPLPTASAR